MTGITQFKGATEVALVVKNPPANRGDIRVAASVPRLGRSPREGYGNPLRILVWRITWTEEHGGQRSMGLQRVGHDWTNLAPTHPHTHTQIKDRMQDLPLFHVRTEPQCCIVSLIEKEEQYRESQTIFVQMWSTEWGSSVGKQPFMPEGFSLSSACNCFQSEN